MPPHLWSSSFGAYRSSIFGAVLLIAERRRLLVLHLRRRTSGRRATASADTIFSAVLLIVGRRRLLVLHLQRRASDRRASAPADFPIFGAVLQIVRRRRLLVLHLRRRTFDRRASAPVLHLRRSTSRRRASAPFDPTSSAPCVRSSGIGACWSSVFGAALLVIFTSCI